MLYSFLLEDRADADATTAALSLPDRAVAVVRAKAPGVVSGMATMTARWVAALEGSGVVLLDTRKTAPGLRWLDRAAVRAGGGQNHREDLASAVLLKENHLALTGGVAEAVRAVRAGAPGLRVVVEVETMEQLREAIGAKADRVLLDEWPDSRAAEGIGLAREAGVESEISGGVVFARLAAVARLCPDYVSAGSLTTAAPPLDLSLAISSDPGAPGMAGE